MGACCSTEEEKGNVDIKNKDNKGGKKGAGVGQSRAGANPSGFNESGDVSGV